MKLNTIDIIALVLVIVGGLNWGLVSMKYNLVEAILGQGAAAAVVYALVGLSAIYIAAISMKLEKQ